MGFSYDANGYLIQSRMFLANPQKKYIGELVNPKAVDLTLNLFNLDEITFDIYQFENEEETEFYSQILPKKLIELQYFGWFQIEDANPVQDDVMQCEVKRVKCLSLENELVDKHIDYISGVYSLYDFADREHSLLHQIVANTNWKIGHVDNDLLSKKRTFDIDNARKYNFLTTDVSKSFECAFIFDTYAKTINAYKLENIGELTDIIIHANNILKNYEQVSSGADIITKMRVSGADGFDIRNVNPISTNELINIDYFLKPISESGWMTDGLVTAFNNYKTAYQNVMSTYNTNRNLLKTQLQELTTLKSQLIDLEGLKKAKEEVQGTYIQMYRGTPPFGSQEYTLYLNAVNDISSYVTQIAIKKVEITSKENQVANTRGILDNIGVDLNLSNFLTQEQMDELTVFLTEGEVYQDPTFVITDSMTDEEILDMQIELMDNASNELFRASQPQITTTTTINNLFTMRDDRDSPISIEEWRDKFNLGNLISLKFRDDYFSTVRLIQMKIKFNNLSDIEVTFSDKNRMDDKLVQLEEVIANAGRTSSALSLGKYGYDKASSITNKVRDFMNGTLNATLNAVQSNDNQEMYLDTYGLHMRKWLPNQNLYDNHQSWLTSHNMLFTSDGWKSSQMAMGLLTAPDGETYYGIATPVLIGDLIIGNKLAIENNSGTYTINDNGLTATKGIYSVGINPNTPSEILNVKVNGINKIYMDTVNNKLVIKGHLEAESGKFSGEIFASTININNNFSVDLNGHMIAKSGEVAGFTFVNDPLLGGLYYDRQQEGKYMRISPFSTWNPDGSYNKAYGSIDLGLSPDGKNTIIHLRSDGYARFGLQSLNGSVKFNYSANGKDYSMYTKNFRIETNGFISANYIEAIPNEELWLTGSRGILIGADSSDLTMYGNNIAMSTLSGTFKCNGSIVLTSGNYSPYINTSNITPSLTSAGNIDFAGSENAAAVNWVQGNFSPIGHSHSGYASSSHGHSEYASSSALSSLASRVSALEKA